MELSNKYKFRGFCGSTSVCLSVRVKKISDSPFLEFGNIIIICRYLKPDKGKKSKHKTRVARRALNPEFNEVRPIFLLVIGSWNFVFSSKK